MCSLRPFAVLRHPLAALAFWLAIPASYAQFAPNRYALLTEDPPVVSRFAARGAAAGPAALSYRQQVLARQATLRARLSALQVPVTGSAATLMNAVFVAAPESRLAELQRLEGVAAVVPLRRYRLSLNRAAYLVRAPAAWDALGGAAASGAGLKIAVLDTGIDHTHPAFQDASLPVPPGYPRCTEGDCAYTNNKVIVARSYVRMLAAGSGTDPAADSRPDDYSARDREGHGTAVASAAAGARNTGAVSISGIAPKAYLGNYKIYGSPQVNEYTFDDVIIQALEDAIDDGMDVISFSTGGAALTGPLDTGSACGLPPGTPCDLTATAFERAAQAGVIIVAAAGNEGNDGVATPTFHSIASPGNAPSVMAVGASTNSHYFTQGVRVLAPGAPSNLQSIEGVFGDAPLPAGTVVAPLRDVSRLGNDGLACDPLPSGSLAGAFALILRGACTFAVKAGNAAAAEAAGVIFYMADPSPLIAPGGLAEAAIPAMMISNADGLALKTYLASNADALVAMDPDGREVVDGALADMLAAFSSLGPSTGGSLVKPELVAPGTDLYMATQDFDPLGIMYTGSRYVSASGTSFATPLVSGAAALVCQRHPGFTAAQVRSALINTASGAVTTDSSGAAVTPQSVGAGKLDALAAVNTAVTVEPSTVSFGVLGAGMLPLARELRISNTAATALTLNLTVESAVSADGTSLTIDRTSLSVPANSSAVLNLALTGAMPKAGAYSGTVKIEGPGVTLRVPYQYFVSTGVPANLIGLAGGGGGTVGQSIPTGIMAVRVVDAYGAPVSGVPVVWSGGLLSGTITASSPATDLLGVSTARALLRSTPGAYSFTASAGALKLSFRGLARAVPAIAAGGVVNAASFEQDAPVAPGSYVALFGAGLSDVTDANSSSRLPLALDYVNVSFDVPSAGLSLPARLVFVSPGQVNIQVPWELQGQTSAKVKVRVDNSYGNVVTVPLSDYAPAFFETGGGIAAALDEKNQVIGAVNQAVRGQVVQLFANGLGPVTNQPASGEPAPVSPLAETTARPVVTIGGLPATVEWSGLTPTLAGLYQVNARVPAGLAPGNHQITVSIGGKTSKAAILPVK